MQTPNFNLDEVKLLVDEWRKGKPRGWFSAISCSIDYVIYIFECTHAAAQSIIFDGILKLETENFSRRVLVWDSVTDEYGLESYLGFNWYIKFLVDDGVLEQISFHPCEKDMTLANGRTIKASIKPNELPSWRK